MFLYVIIISILTFFSFLEVLKNGQKNSNVVFLEILFCFFPLILLVSLRSVGFDYNTYENAYDELHYLSLKEIFKDIQFEPGFVFLNILAPNFIFLISTLGLVTLLVKYQYVARVSPLPVVSLLILFLGSVLNFEMGQIRQAFAMSVLLFSTQFFFTSKTKFLFAFLIAVLFHYSALIFLFIFFLPKKIIKWYYYLILIIFAFLLYLTLEPALFLIADLLPGFSGAKLMLYYEIEQGEIGISIPILLIKLVLLILFYFLKSKIREFQIPLYELIFNIYFFSLFIYIAFAFFPQISGRGGAYFGIFEIILIPIILNAIDNVLLRITAFLFIFFIYMGIFIKFLMEWGESFIPYNTWI